MGGTHSAHHLCQSIAKMLPDASVLVLAAIVSGAPYAADIENRRRMRYAVLAGLYRSGYMPFNNQHVGYVRLAEFYDDPSRANDLAAFEWFDSSVRPDVAVPLRPSRVLLLWLDQDGFRKKPIHQFSKIADGLLPTGVRSVILGPANSEGLRAIIEEAAHNTAAPTSGSRSISVYSPRASAGASAIVRSIAPTTSVSGELELPMAHVRLYRTIATDDTVAQAMCRELALRHVAVGEIALIAERDTLYGRSMGDYFNHCKDSGPLRLDRDGPAGGNAALLRLTYLKGLDGVGPPPPKQAATQSAVTATELNSSDGASLDAAGRADGLGDASTGSRQLDYLRRMGRELVALQGAPSVDCHAADQPRGKCPPRYIKAIGIMGTDIYDKLLILQEMRPMFPDAIFFTFGLDARYADNENLPYTRQLLVGSSLGLALRPEFQQDIPAFRDSYQSTTFYSTLLALHRASIAQQDEATADDAGLEWTSQAMVFEIGRNQPVDLNIDPHSGEPCDPDARCYSLSATRTVKFLDTFTRTAVGWLVVLVPLAAWMLARAALGRAAMHRRIGRLPVSATRLLIVLAVGVAILIRLTWPWQWVLAYLTGNGQHMPVPIADGASHWGKELFEALLLPVVLTLLIRGQRKLTGNANAIFGRFHLQTSNQSLVQSYGSAVRELPWTHRVKEWMFVPFGHLSTDRDKAVPLPGISPLESLIARYLYRGVWQRRWARVLAASILFVLALRLLEWLGFSLFAGVPWILVQLQKHGVEGVISFLSFTGMQVLIFWVVDAILLTRAFLLDLSRDDPGWPKTPMNEMRAEMGLSDDLASIWLNLRLVALRTSWVGNFIWYPSIGIAAMFAATITVEYGNYRFDSNPVTLVASVIVIVASVISLRQAAEGWRADLLQRLEHRHLSSLAAKPSNPESVTQIEVLIALVTQLRDGAFAPFSEQPLVRAVLLPGVTFAAAAGFPFLHAG